MPYYLCWDPHNYRPEDGEVVHADDGAEAAEYYAATLYAHEPSEYTNGANVTTHEIESGDVPLRRSDVEAEDWRVEPDWHPTFTAVPA